MVEGVACDLNVDEAKTGFRGNIAVLNHLHSHDFEECRKRGR